MCSPMRLPTHPTTIELSNLTWSSPEPDAPGTFMAQLGTANIYRSIEVHRPVHCPSAASGLHVTEATEVLRSSRLSSTRGARGELLTTDEVVLARDLVIRHHLLSM